MAVAICPLYRLLPVIYSQCLCAIFTRFRLCSCHDKCSTCDTPFWTSEIQVTYCRGGIAVTGRREQAGNDNEIQCNVPRSRVLRCTSFYSGSGLCWRSAHWHILL
ncbi:hypothetical protein ARMGADRAFT_782717 [Armillaria gallica]|uniref:Uncharacterized protein n=1 Tax=Armillaria gallica TaxID=47427 RepID=A0A2H3CQ87_ARMGA|nr:hypothetical protein ARMGADRAFT_782717 [Armillaria gallica]